MQRFVRPFRTPGQFLFIPGVGSVEDVVPQGNNTVDYALGRTPDTYNLQRTQQDRAAAYRTLEQDPNNPTAERVLENTP